MTSVSMYQNVKSSFSVAFCTSYYCILSYLITAVFLFCWVSGARGLTLVVAKGLLKQPHDGRALQHKVLEGSALLGETAVLTVLE